jgi:deoxyribodipyrimidine photo-lyase
MNETLKPVPKRLIGHKLSEDFSAKSAERIAEFRSELDRRHEAAGYRQRLQVVTEREAHQTLQDFLNERSVKYRGNISSPNTALTHGSRLSVHLAWGTLSIRCVYRTAKQKMSELQNPLPDGKPNAAQRRHYLSLKSFTARLHWRDHFIQRLEDQPDMPDHALNIAFENIEFVEDSSRLEAWIEGRTGEPMVDACMRCLGATGFVNFRMRSMCLSYGVYALHLDWRILGRAMARLFYDYEPGIHWSQVQMQAGVVGINTIRVYSPSKQLLDQDPDCQFVKKWIPELAHFSAEEIQNCGKQLFDLAPYPVSLVPFKEQSAAMKKIVYGIKNGAENREVKAEVFRKHGSRIFKSRTKRKGPSTDTKLNPHSV